MKKKYFYFNWICGFGLGYWRDRYSPEFDTTDDYSGESIKINDVHHFMIGCCILSFGSFNVSGGQW
jgi:hypothetical protein